MQKEPGENQWLAKPFSFAASFVQSIYYEFASGVRNTTTLYLDLINIKKENAILDSENTELKTQLNSLSELQLENERLNELLNFKQKTKMQLLAAKIISRDLLSDHATVQINRGTNDGLKPGQAVITTEGAVGYIFRPEPLTAQVLLVTDRYAVVDGIVQRTRARGIVEGYSPTTCQLRYVEKSEDITVGDLVVTSGLDNIFPKGFPVAKVEFIEHKPHSVTLRVDLKPVVDSRKLEEVFVILNSANENFDETISMLEEPSK